jgi:GAF domain-containing protein
VGVTFRELAGDRRLVFRDPAAARRVEVEDAASTALRDHPLVAGEPRLRFFCAVPLVTPDGHAVGALAVADRVPRRLGAAERTALENLAAIAVARLEARAAAGPEIDAADESLRQAQELLAREREISDAVIQGVPGAFALF